MYPVDLLKVRSCWQSARLSVGDALTCRQTRMQIVNPSPSAMYSGISNAMVTISRAEGFTALWRGLSSVVMGAGMSIQFCHFTQTQRLTTSQAPRMPSISHLTKLRNMLSAETKVEARNTILLQQVGKPPVLFRLQVC